MLTAHSEYGQLTKVYVKSPEAAFISQAILDLQWREHRFLNSPDYLKAVEEHQGFCRLLELAGAELEWFPNDPAVSIDSIYCRDASIHTDFGVILCAMGKPVRRQEPGAAEKYYRAAGEKFLDQ